MAVERKGAAPDRHGDSRCLGEDQGWGQLSVDITPTRTGVGLGKDTAVAGRPTREELYVVPHAPSENPASDILNPGNAATPGDGRASDTGVGESDDP